MSPRPKKRVSDSNVPTTEYDDDFDASVNLARAGFAIARALDAIAHQIDRLGMNGTIAPDGAMGYIEQAIREGTENIAGALGNLTIVVDQEPGAGGRPET